MAQETENQHDVATKTKSAAEQIAKELGMEIGAGVKARSWARYEHDVIIVTWNEVAAGVNGFRKGSIINDVYQSDANVELQSAEDGNAALQFKLRD